MPEPIPPSARALAYVAAVKAVKIAITAFCAQADPKAKVIPRFVFDEDGDKWAGLLRSDNDVDPTGIKRVHAVTVFYDGLDLADPEFNVVMKSIRPVIPIGVAFYRGYELGTNENNVEDDMTEKMGLTQFLIAENPTLGLKQQKIAGHSNLRMPKIFPIWLGKQQTFTSKGTIRVHMEARQLVGGAG